MITCAVSFIGPGVLCFPGRATRTKLTQSATKLRTALTTDYETDSIVHLTGTTRPTRAPDDIVDIVALQLDQHI